MPSLYQVNTRVWLGELGRRLGRPATLDDTPNADLDALARLGFDWLWLLGVWQTGPAGRAVSWAHPDLRKEYDELLPDRTDDDVVGSPFAIRSYTVHTDFGGDAELARLRKRLHDRGIRLMLDFVPNHVALDHRWLDERREFFIYGSDADLEREPQNWFRSTAKRIVAHGRDPYFPGWPDTAQLNYRCPALRAAMLQELLGVATRCDGVRCDMAMLLLPDVIAQTWGERSRPADGSPPADDSWWPEAIGAVREQSPEFTFLAEVYWDREWELQQLGFDYTYDKRLYDRLREHDAVGVHGHLHADPQFMNRSMRFLENHDEARAAAAFGDAHRAAATIAFLVPGLLLIHDGQLDGRTRRVSLHLARRADEPRDDAIAKFYGRLLGVRREIAARPNSWSLCEVEPVSADDDTHESFVAFTWKRENGDRWLVAVNFGPQPGLCRIVPPWNDEAAMVDRFRETTLTRDPDGGFVLDAQPWQAFVLRTQEPRTK